MEIKIHPNKIEILIDISEKLFAESGYGETSVRDISKEAGVNVAMVNYYFGSKKHLLEAIIKNRTLSLWKEFKAGHKINKNIDYKSIVNYMVTSVYSRPNFFMLMVQIKSIARMGVDLGYFNHIQDKFVDYITKRLQHVSGDSVTKERYRSLISNSIAILLNRIINTNFLTESDQEQFIMEQVRSDILSYFKSVLAN